MKFETLITRYKNLGYTPKNIDDNEVELECLINWVYKRYNIYIYVMHYDRITQKCYKKYVPKIKGFSANRIWNCGTEYSHTFYGDKYFDEAFDAKFDCLREICRAIRFQYHK